MSVRKPVFAGTWYPAGADECEQLINSFLKETRFDTDIKAEAISGIVPHAGWPFSGDLACKVISAVRGNSGNTQPDIVAVFGMHLPPGAQPHIMTRGSWQTPFGDLDIASEIAEPIASQYRCKIETPEDFTPDNTIELQLPFVKYFFGNARLLPIGTPPSETGIQIGHTVAEEARKQGLQIKVIGSTDLTHYGPSFGFTPAGTGREAFEWVKNKNDKQAIDRMLAMDPEGVVREGLSNQNACCAGAAAAAIAAARDLGSQKAHLAGYSSSYEKNPDSTFVGYGGVVYTLGSV
ncbi:MAG: AmmeMemoRadiSam system protein B [Desulfobacteraceae bacterium]|nr:AmmeMemoRadiSam system protein B [Desulfobacteraceae bacterium]